jgi:hypothetical protein
MANALVMAALPIAGVAASSTLVGSPAYIANDYMGIVWQAAEADSASIVVDMGSNVTVDTIALLGVARAASFATMTIWAATAAQGSGFTGGAYWVGATVPLYAGSVRLVNGHGVGLWLADPANPPPVARYWRIAFASLSGMTVQLSRVAIGAKLQLQRNFKFGAQSGVRDLGKVEYSPRGVMLRRRSAKHRTLSLSFAAAHRDEVEEQIAPLLEQCGNTDPLLLITDPAAHAMRERRSYFGCMTGDLSMIWRTAAGHEWRIELESLL